MWKMNKGSTTIEMVFIMPIVIIIIFMFIRIMVFQLDEARYRNIIADYIYVGGEGNEIMDNSKGMFSSFAIITEEKNKKEISISAKTSMDLFVLWQENKLEAECKYRIKKDDISDFLRGYKLID